MSYAKRILQLPTTRVQQLVGLAIMAALAFSLGMAANAIGRSMGLPIANDQPSVAGVAAEAQNQPAVAAPAARPAMSNPNVPAYVEYLARPAMSNPNVPAFGTGSVYDGGQYRAVEIQPYGADWELYDNGWAGGPKTLHGTSSASGLYGAGWELYDNGWAGGPRTAPDSQTGK
jgi:hypothetical protein